MSLKAIILAAGYGTRLKEAGEDRPKGLIEFGNTCLISKTVEELRKVGVEEIAVVTNSKYFDAYMEWTDTQTNIELIDDGTTAPENRLGALGDLQFAIKTLEWEKENIIVAPSDTYFEFSLQRFVDLISQKPEEFAEIARKTDIEEIRNRIGCAVLNENNRVIEFVEKPSEPKSDIAMFPFYYYPASISAKLSQYKEEGNSMDAPGNFVPWLLKNNLPVNACVVTETTVDVGTPKELAWIKSK